MIFPEFYNPAFVALVALLPGALAWWTGRRLAAAAEDPALPEILLARQQRLLMWATGAMAVSLVFGGRHALWAIPLIGVGILIGGFPLRRALGIESGSLGGHLWRSAKSVLGGIGFWILLAWAPDIVLSIDPRYRLLGVALLPILMLWEHWYPRIWLWLHESAPLRDSTLEPRFAAINERAGISAPAIYRIGGPGTRFMNALAFPSVSRPTIGLGSALLELLEPDEASAIYAHELAHIEHFAPRRIRRLQLLARLLIVVAVALPFAALRVIPEQAAWVAWLWPVVILAFLIQRSRSSQQHETESDLRAAALCGDPEAVVRALIKLHVHSFMPRRWPVDFERNATHPSLARRIQALRGQGEAAVAAAGAPLVLATGREGSVVVFDDRRAYWFDGVPPGTAHDLEALRAEASSSRSVAWPELIELRVTTQGGDRALRATHHNGDTWSVPLRPGDVVPVQQALDVVDVRLRRELGKRPGMAVQLVAALTFFATVFSGAIGVLLVPVTLALFRPSSAAIAALGAMAAGRGLLGVVSPEESWFPGEPRIALAVVAALGAAGLWIAWRRVTREGRRDGTRLTLWVVGGMAALLLVPLAFALPQVPAGLVLDLPMVTPFAVSLLGLGAVLLMTGRRRARVAGAVAAFLGGAAGAAPLLTSRGPGGIEFTQSAAAVEEIDRADFPVQVGQLRLSPGGQRYLVLHYDPRNWDRGRTGGAMRYTTGLVGGERRSIDAMAVEFLDDDHLLALRTSANGYDLTLELADSGTVVWTIPIPDLFDPSIAVLTADRSWTVAGEDETDSLTILIGGPGPGAPRIARFAHPDSLPEMIPIVVGAGARVVVPGVSMRGNTLLPLLTYGLLMPRVTMWEAGTDGMRSLGEIDGVPECMPMSAEGSLCYTRARRRGGIWLVEADTLRSLGDIPVGDPAAVTLGPGPTLTVTHRLNRVMHLDVEKRRAVDMELSADSAYVSEARVAGGRLAVIRHVGSQSQVVIYAVKQ